MSKIISMPPTSAYREGWDRIFGKEAADNGVSKATEEKSEKNSCRTGCGCGKKGGGKKA